MSVKVFAVCADDCRHESMTKAQILEAIEAAIENGYVSDPENAVFSRIKEIKDGKTTKLWVGTESQFNEINPLPDVQKIVVRMDAEGVLYLYSDDSTLGKMAEKDAVDLEQDVENALPIQNGGTGAATKAAALSNLGITYGTGEPSGGDDGDIYFQIVG